MVGLLERGREIAMFFIAMAHDSRPREVFTLHKDVFHPYGGVTRLWARDSDVFHRYGS
ncbi:hypothetical protein [Paenibacillus sp. Soil724D2]|uniref:hypothetical protein n=1 Tax=Paenibacillus sp. (strain Soil724D2) TaxID=1736392 RepID=UPI000AF15DCF|nr:hypothetical protein [Paenibacillus sp. Soil724D2]